MATKTKNILEQFRSLHIVWNLYIRLSIYLLHQVPRLFFFFFVFPHKNFYYNDKISLTFTKSIHTHTQRNIGVAKSKIDSMHVISGNDWFGTNLVKISGCVTAMIAPVLPSLVFQTTKTTRLLLSFFSQIPFIYVKNFRQFLFCLSSSVLNCPFRTRFLFHLLFFLCELIALTIVILIHVNIDWKIDCGGDGHASRQMQSHLKLFDKHM